MPSRQSPARRPGHSAARALRRHALRWTTPVGTRPNRVTADRPVLFRMRLDGRVPADVCQSTAFGSRCNGIGQLLGHPMGKRDTRVETTLGSNGFLVPLQREAAFTSTGVVYEVPAQF